MRKTALLVMAAAILSAVPVVTADEVETTTLTGEFVWGRRGNSGDLEAIFIAAGEGEWTVDFHFFFRDKAHVYSGTAEGSLSEGTLRGTVQNENKQRTFTFEGEFQDGAFKGTHAEVEDGEEHRTGTLELSG